MFVRFPGTKTAGELTSQLSGFRKHEMKNPLALCELAARAPNISAGHMIKQV